MKYVYKIEVECSRHNGKYAWSVLARPEYCPYAEFDTCAIGLSNYIWDAFNDALHCKTKLEKEQK